MSLIDRFMRWFKSTLPGDVHALNGHRAVDAADYCLAATEFEEALRLGVRNYPLAQVYTMLGTAYDGLNRHADAISAHTKAIGLAPDFHEAWNNLGIAHFSAGQLDQAVECTHKALQLRPDYAFAYGSLGGIEIHRNAPSRAIEYLQKAITLNPGMAVAHSNLALAYGMTGRFDKAESALKCAVTLGYRNWKEIRSRLENLKEFGQVAADDSSEKRPIGFTIDGT